MTSIGSTFAKNNLGSVTAYAALIIGIMTLGLVVGVAYMIVRGRTLRNKTRDR